MVKVQWYPGHMEKARRQMNERLKAVDMIIEVRDARIPNASANPLLKEMAPSKPRLIVLAKSDIADPEITKQWLQAFQKENQMAIALDLSHDAHAGRKVIQACGILMRPIHAKQMAKGIRPRAARAMAAGIPNVGKSTLINRIAGKNTVVAADKPGVTRSLTWIHADPSLDLLDTPGVLWPKFEDERTGSLLAACGAINENILDLKAIAMDTIHAIQDLYPGVLEKEFHTENVNPNGMLKAIADQRHLVLSEGEPDTKRAASVFLHEFRRGKYGPLTLERPS
ncbi:MAG: ribosome biogenesis GTPase YlqF [Lactimicrobium sp.]|jgi:ribosome biogenesis GTPase A|uniref:ribosome biogenesis GTPase YlqF n=1 Tax=Lactimicrobium sp. TaxID=2563780 RepID=UPI002F3508AF